jgi:hypothetical protein
MGRPCLVKMSGVSALLGKAAPKNSSLLGLGAVTKERVFVSRFLVSRIHLAF